MHHTGYLVAMTVIIAVVTLVSVPSLFARKCPGCGKRNRVDARRCRGCGTELPPDDL